MGYKHARFLTAAGDSHGIQAIGWAGFKVPVFSLATGTFGGKGEPYWHQRGFTERNPPPV